MGLDQFPQLLAQRDHQRLAERAEGVAETRVHLFQRTAKLDVVLLGRRLVLLDRRQGSPQFQQRGLNDGFRLLEFRDFFSQLGHFLFQPVHSPVHGIERVSGLLFSLHPNRIAWRNQALGTSPDVSIRLIVSDGKRTLKE